MIWQGNPCARIPGGKAVSAALAEVPLLVHLSSYPCETFHRSHVSLPVSSWLECAGLVANNNGRAIQWHHKVVAPPGECRSPLEIWQGLAAACSVGPAFPLFGEAPAAVEEVADHFLRQNPLTRLMTAEKLDPEKNPPGGLLWPCVSAGDLEFESNRCISGDIRGRNILFQRGRPFPDSATRFPTPSGKITLPLRSSCDRAETIDPAKEPSSCPPPGRDPHFPVKLITGLLVDFVEEYGYFVSDRDCGTAAPIVKIHPGTGKFLGVNNGDPIVVENDRGSLTAPAWLSEEVAPGVAWCPEGLDPFQPGFDVTSPRSLFAPPGPCSGGTPFTRVMISTPGRDRTRTAKELSAFLDALASEGQ